MESVSSGLKSLGETTSKLSDISSASVATDEYVKNIKGASDSAASMSRSYSQAAQAMGDLASAVEDTKLYKDEVAKLAKNLQALNGVYGNMLSAMNVKA